MKRIGNLYQQICSFENLLAAALRARRGKRYRPDVLHFHYHLEAQILQLQKELQSMQYRPGPYRTFHIRDPKRRLISAASYRDRVVHHALCRIIEPILERTFVFDSYANRTDKGTHKAIDRCTYFTRQYPFVLKCDIEKYFPSIDHEILLSLVARKIKCSGTLRLVRSILENSNEQEGVDHYFPGDDLFTPFTRRHGIPIGNLTSQIFANVMLNPFDHFIKERLGCRGYVRFVDDFLVFGREKKELNRMIAEIQAYLNNFRLKIHPNKCQVMPTRCGVDFLGWKVFPDHRRLRRSTGVCFQRGLRVLREEYALGTISQKEIKNSIMSWIGHLSHGDTWGLRSKLLGEACFVRGAL